LKGSANLTVGSSQLRWVILLLVIAVVLPTIGLLWFINQAVKNERLAVRQKLVAAYQDKLEAATQKTADTWSKHLEFLNSIEADAHPCKTFVSLVIDNKYNGLIVYDAKGPLIYPTMFNDSSSAKEMAEVFDQAWQLEFFEQKYDQAALLYNQNVGSSNNYIHLTALVSKSRCLAKLGRLDEAIDECKKAAFSPLEKQGDVQILVLIGNARLLLLNFLQQNEKYADLFEETFKKLFSGLYITDETGPALPANCNVFLGQKALEFLKEYPSLKDKLKLDVEKLDRLVAAEQLSIDIARHFPTAQSLITLQEDKFQQLKVPEHTIYSLYHKSGKNIYLLLLSQENICSAFGDYQRAFADSDSVYRIIGGSGRFVAGVS